MGDSNSEGRFRRLVETMNDGVIVLDAEGRITYANPRLVEMLHADAGSMLGKLAVDFLPDQQNRSVLTDQLARRQTGGEEGYEIVLTADDGTPVSVLVSPRPLFDEEGRFEGSVAVVTEITERKKAEAERERLTAIVESATDMISLSTADRRVVYVNPAGLELLGWARDGLAGRKLDDSHPGWVRDKLVAEALPALLRDGYWRGESAIVDAAGREIPVSQVITVHRSGDGAIEHYSTIVRDMTELRRLEEQLRQSQKMEAIGRLAGGIAHDFGNLLTGIRGFAELVESSLVEGDPLAADVAEIRKAAEQATWLTTQLLAFARKPPAAATVLDLGAVVGRSERMLRRIIGEDVAVRVVLGEGLWPVRSDPAQVDQVLVNLFVNSRDAMPRGGEVVVEIANVVVEGDDELARGGAPAGAHVALRVSDTGCGMDAETREKVFEPFFTTKPTGTGLGLSTVYGIVQQSGGFITIDSAPGSGTRVTILFPRHGGPVTGPDDRAATAVPTGFETVLVVDDNETIRRLSQRALARQGYRVLEANDGESARLLAERLGDAIHLLLTDVVMQGMDGRELYEKLLERRPELEVLYMSGFTGDTVARHGVPGGGERFIQKPFTADELGRKVREALDRGKNAPTDPAG